MGMFPSPFPPIAASPPADGRDLQLGDRRTSHRRNGAGDRCVAERTHPRALSAGPRTHVGDPVDRTPPPTRQPVAARASDHVCRASGRANGDLLFGERDFRRSAVRGRVSSQSNPGIATRRRARVDRAHNPLRQRQPPSDEPTVPVATTWAGCRDGAGGRRRRVGRSLNGRGG